MADNHNLSALLRAFNRHGKLDLLAELSLSGNEVRYRLVGSNDALDEDLKKDFGHLSFKPEEPNKQYYYFLSRPVPELRPGSGLIRMFGGKPEGPGGTLTCFLSSKDGSEDFILSAGHVLSNFWADEDIQACSGEAEHEILLNVGRGGRSHRGRHRRGPKSRRTEPTASIYRYQKGYPATNSTRFLGKLERLSKNPVLRAEHWRESRYGVNVDLGVVKLEGEFDLKQRTTCYGSFGEFPETCEQMEPLEIGSSVMKCGAEEPHLTTATVEGPVDDVTVYGPGGNKYVLNDQVILRSGPLTPEKLFLNTDPPAGWPEESDRGHGLFAVPGDSGTMVVEEKSRRPVGMLIAGSVLDGRYVMTPIRQLCEFLGNDYIFRKG